MSRIAGYSVKVTLHNELHVCIYMCLCINRHRYTLWIVLMKAAGWLINFRIFVQLSYIILEYAILTIRVLTAFIIRPTSLFPEG